MRGRTFCIGWKGKTFEVTLSRIGQGKEQWGRPHHNEKNRITKDRKHSRNKKEANVAGVEKDREKRWARTLL